MESDSKRITYENLKQFCAKALRKNGMCAEYADIAAGILAQADMYGTHSHGTKNLHNYIKKMYAGGIERDAVPEVIKEGPAFAVIDGHHIIGMVSAYKAMERAIEKASETGISCVLVKNGSHFGAAGCYANMAARHGMIGLSLSNVDANMTVPGAKGQVIGNNPFSYAAPYGGGNGSVFLDVAMSSVASLKVIQAKKNGLSIPDSWITDAEGRPTTDPSKYPDEGAMQPMAGHKGYGLALMVEILTGVLSGGGMTSDIPSWLFSLDTKNNVSYMFIVLDISKFMPMTDFTQRMDDIADRLHTAPRASDSKGVFLPGEMEWSKVREAEKTGISLPLEVVSSLEGLSKACGVSIHWE